MSKKQVIGIGLTALLVVLVIYSRMEHNKEQDIKNLSYHELEEELIKLEEEYDKKLLMMSEKEKADMERKYTIIMQELEEKDKKERDDRKAEEIIKYLKYRKNKVDPKDLGTGYWDPNLNKWIDTTSKPVQPNDEGGNSLNDSEPR